MALPQSRPTKVCFEGCPAKSREKHPTVIASLVGSRWHISEGSASCHFLEAWQRQMTSCSIVLTNQKFSDYTNGLLRLRFSSSLPTSQPTGTCEDQRIFTPPCCYQSLRTIPLQRDRRLVVTSHRNHITPLNPPSTSSQQHVETTSHQTYLHYRQNSPA